MKKAKTIAEGASFSYEDKITIRYGKNRPINLSLSDLAELLLDFRGRKIFINTSRTKTRKGSLGFWLNPKDKKTAIANYVAAILVEEGFAKKVGNNKIRFF